MPRPKSKKELVALSNKNYQRLFEIISSFSEEQLHQEFPKGTLNRNTRDVLAHLHHWHLMMINWYTIGMKGLKPDMPAKGYTWKMTPELNKEIWKKYNDEPIESIREQLQNSFEALQKIINKHSEEELFEKRRYKWTGTTSMASYLISATSSHYDWAYKLIKKSIK